MNAEVVSTQTAPACPVTHPGFGPHGGKQWRSPRYFVCGCDAGYCANHAQIGRLGGPPFEPGKPRSCRKHAPHGIAGR